MKHYKIWQAPILAFFSTQFYREVGASGKGVGFVYLLALLTIVCAIGPIKEISGMQPAGHSIIEQLPEALLTLPGPTEQKYIPVVADFLKSAQDYFGFACRRYGNSRGPRAYPRWAAQGGFARVRGESGVDFTPRRAQSPPCRRPTIRNGGRSRAPAHGPRWR